MAERVTDAIGAAERIRSGEVSAREVVEEAIRRIEKYDPELNAVVSTRYEEALAEVDRGLPDGPLRGVPTLIKDLNADVAGLPATGGSRLFADARAERDSELVARYRRAGMVVLGMTNSPEFGKNASTEPLLHGSTRNPWNPAHSPGGSSGGSAAAVAAGMVPVAHGTDGGGSIRIPASMCGLFGLKPSRGRVPAAPYAAALASPVTAHHALTTTVRDSALLLDIAAGPVRGAAFGAPTPERPFLEEVGRPPGRLRIGIATTVPGDVPVHPACVAAVERAAATCRELGHEVTEVTLDFDPSRVQATSGTIMAAGLAQTVDERLRQLGRELRDDDLEPFTRVMLERGRTIPGAQVIQALQHAEELGWQVGRMFADSDLLLLPTIAQPPPPLGLLDTTRPEVIYRHASTYAHCTSVFNVTGQPAMSVPFGSDETGLPIGVQFAADLGGEGLLLRLAAQLEQAVPWPLRAPDYVPE
jgi:amidase